MNQGNPSRSPGRGRSGRGREDATAGRAYFDPGRPKAELVDELAEKQADELPQINSSQLRKFFGEVKDLYRRLQARQDYHSQIEPQFKMLRSKAYYASRPGGQQQISPQFRNFIENAVKRVGDEKDFRLFVAHFEAVVGFLYGKRKVRR